MKRYLLDTALLAAYLLGRAGAVSRVSPWIRDQEAATTILNYAEVVEYIRGLHNFQPLRAHLRSLVAEVTPYFPTFAIAERYADIRLQLRPSGGGSGLIGDIDTLIAATALDQNLTLVTTDSDFLRVPGLTVILLTRGDLRSP